MTTAWSQTERGIWNGFNDDERRACKMANLLPSEFAAVKAAPAAEDAPPARKLTAAEIAEGERVLRESSSGRMIADRDLTEK